MTDAHTIADVDTETGNRLLQALTSEGWKVVDQYAPTAFDKGIDYDHYVLARDGRRITCTWDNWTEWSIACGDADLAQMVRTRIGQIPPTTPAPKA